MPIYDFECQECENLFEEITPKFTETIPCPECAKEAVRLVSTQHHLTTIIPSYPGCKKHKAGYVHTHKDRPATKIQSGYGGCVSPSNN